MTDNPACVHRVAGSPEIERRQSETSRQATPKDLPHIIDKDRSEPQSSPQPPTHHNYGKLSRKRQNLASSRIRGGTTKLLAQVALDAIEYDGYV